MGSLTGRGAVVMGSSPVFTGVLADAVAAGCASVFRHDLADGRSTEDITESAVEDAFDRAVLALSSVDIVLNVVSLGADPHPLLEVSEPEWRRSLAVSVRASFFVTRRAVQEFLGSGGGRILTVLDASAGAGLTRTVAEPALLALNRCVAKEYGRRGVACNALVVEDPAPDLPALAEAVVYLASDASSFVTGEHLTVDRERATCQR